MTENQNDLEPCPFCGGKPTEELISQGYDNPEWWIECASATCTANPGLGDSCRDDARRRWNTRATSPVERQIAAIREGLKQFLFDLEEDEDVSTMMFREIKKSIEKILEEGNG